MKWFVNKHDGYIYSIVVLSNGNYALGSDGNIQIWNALTGECLFDIRSTDTSPISSLICLNDDSLISGSDSGSIKIWRILSGEYTPEVEIMHSDGTIRLIVACKNTLISIGDYSKKSGKYQLVNA